MRLGKRIMSMSCAVLMVLTLIVSVPSGVSAAATRETLRVASGKTYVLETYFGKAIDIDHSQTGNGVNVQQWGKNNSNAQKFVLTLQDTANYGYTIKAVVSGKYLDVSGVSRASGTNIHQWEYTGGANQLWYFEDAGDGWVYIRSGMGTYMDVKGSGTADGTNIWAYSFNGTNAQKYRIREVLDNAGTLCDAPLMRKSVTVDTDKVYFLEAYNGKVVEIQGGNRADTTNVAIWENSSAYNQKFAFSLKDTEYLGYAITCTGTDGSLDVSGVSRASGANIWQCHYTGSGAANQLWYVEDAGDGYVYIRSGMGTYMAVADGGTANGTNIAAYAFDGSNSQKFRLVEYVEPVSTHGEPLTVAPGKTYLIETYFGKAVDVNGIFKGNGVNVHQWEKNYCGAQQLLLTLADADGFGYSIKCLGTDGYFDVAGVSSLSGANIWQWDYTGAANQFWYFEDAGDGYVYIRSGMGTYMTVADNGTANGTNIRAEAFSDADGQKFKIKEYLDSSDAIGDAKLMTVDGYKTYAKYTSKAAQPLVVLPGETYTLETYFGKAADVEGNWSGNGVNIKQWEHNHWIAQKYVMTLVDAENYGYSIQCVGTGKYMDIVNKSAANGANILQWEWYAGKNQTWYLEDAGDGYVFLRSGVGTYMTVAGSNPDNDANIQAEAFSGEVGQRFRVKAITDANTLVDAQLYTPSEYKEYLYLQSLPRLGGTGANAMSTASLTAERNNAWNAYKTSALNNPVLRSETSNHKITVNGITMKYTVSVKGSKPANGYPLYISLHGGGGTDAQTNNNEWDFMKTYYLNKLKCGVYVTPRGALDVWNMHFLDESYQMYDTLIQYMILTQNVDPNRVYLQGFSAGGDGVYAISPRMADRFAAVNMSSGHPNDVSVVNLKNLPIQLQVGEKDDRFFRNTEAARYDIKLDELQALYGGYIHRTLVHYDGGHNGYGDDTTSSVKVMSNPQAWLRNGDRSYTWINSFPAAYMDQFTRNPLPADVIWDLTTRANMRETTSFYYLSAPKSVNNGLIRANYDRSRNLVTLTADGVNGDFSVLLNENMVDFSRPITFKVNGKTVTAIVTPDRAVLQRTTAERGDPNYQFEAEISFSALTSIANA